MTEAQRTRRKPTTEKTSSGTGDRLATYRAKRSFDVTPEPPATNRRRPAPAAEKKTAGGPRLAFVVQKHDARRLHYDVRLEIEGAMVSWAVPKGPSYDPAVRRLAVQTEDHPMDYNAFEGRIPDGEYGAGDVLIWDRGTYETVPPGQQRAMLDKGHLHVRLFGEKLVGEWHLVRTNRERGGADDGAGGRAKAQWLLFKAKDARRQPRSTTSSPSGPSRSSAARRRRAGRGAWARRSRARARGRSTTRVGDPRSRRPSPRSTTGPDWLFEVKYDGYRLSRVQGGRRRPPLHARAPTTGPSASSRSPTPSPNCPRASASSTARRASSTTRGGRRSRRSRSGSRQRRRIAGRLALRGVRSPVARRARSPRRADRGAARASRGAARGPRGRRSRCRGRSRGGWRTCSAPRKDSRARGARRKAERLDVRGGSIAGTGSSCGSTSGRTAPSSGGSRWRGRRTTWARSSLAVAEGGQLVFAGRVGTGFDDADAAASSAKKLDAERGGRRRAIERAPKTQGRPLGGAGARLRVRVHGVDARRLDAPPAFLGPAGGQDAARVHAREAEAAPRSWRTRRRRDARAPGEAPRRRARDTPKLAQPDQGALPARRHHQARDLGLLHGDRPLHAPAPRRAAAHAPALPGRDRRRGVVPAERPREVAAASCGWSTSGRATTTRSASCATTLETLQWLANLAALTIHQWTSHVPPEATVARGDRSRAGAPRLRRSRSRSGRRPVVAPRRGGPRRPHAPRRAEARELRQDERQARRPRRRAHRRPDRRTTQATGFAEQVARAVAKVLPEDRHRRADEREARRQALRRLRPERRGPHDRLAVHHPRARRRGRVDPHSRGTSSTKPWTRRGSPSAP